MTKATPGRLEKAAARKASAKKTTKARVTRRAQTAGQGFAFSRVLSAFAADPALAHVAEDYASRALAPSRAFGSNGLKVNGKLFALVSSKAEFVVKLPKARVQALVGAGVGRPFEPGPGRLMK